MKTQISSKFYSPKQYKRMFWGTNINWAIFLIALLLLMKNCSDRKDKEHEEEKSSLIKGHESNTKLLTDQIDFLNTVIDSLNEQIKYPQVKAVLEVKREKGGSRVYAQLVSLRGLGLSEVFIKYKIVEKEIEVITVADAEPCPEPINYEFLCLDTLNSKLNVNLERAWKDSTSVLFNSKLSLSKLISLTSYNECYEYNFIEYTKNKYAFEEEKAFRWGLIFAAAATGLYATSEAVGHPKYWDNQNNSSAERKSHLIKGLRTGSTVLGIASALEFGRTIYFHKKSKLYISPTTIKLQINLDK